VVVGMGLRQVGGAERVRAVRTGSKRRLDDPVGVFGQSAGDRDTLCQRLRYLEGRRPPKVESFIGERGQSRPKPLGNSTA
jgi:hypothetical protein